MLTVHLSSATYRRKLRDGELEKLLPESSRLSTGGANSPDTKALAVFIRKRHLSPPDRQDPSEPHGTSREASESSLRLLTPLSTFLDATATQLPPERRPPLRRTSPASLAHGVLPCSFSSASIRSITAAIFVLCA